MLGDILLISFIVILILKYHSPILYRLRLTWFLFSPSFMPAGYLIMQEGPTSERNQAISYLAKAANTGTLEAMVPLGETFEIADEPDKAVMVYNILENRTRDVSPFLNAMANDRLDTLRASRVRSHKSV